jgi:hypothetical protein
MLLHDNARPHTAACTPVLLEHFNWELFDQIPYSPDLASSDYHLLPEEMFGSQRFNNDELMRGAKSWLSSQAYRNLFSDATSASVPEMTTCRSSLSMHVYIFLYTIIFSLLVLLTAHRGVTFRIALL